MLSVMYGIGHLFQSVMYLGSVYTPQLYAHQFHLFRMLFKWTDLLTLMATLIYVFRSTQNIQKRHDFALKKALRAMPESPATKDQMKAAEQFAPPPDAELQLQGRMRVPPAIPLDFFS